MTKRTKLVLLALLVPNILLLGAVLFLSNGPSRVCSSEKVSSRGHGSPMRSLAEIQAVGDWKKRAAKISANMTDWHNAKNGKLNCQFREKSGNYHCRAYGTPCEPLKHEEGKQFTAAPALRKGL